MLVAFLTIVMLLALNLAGALTSACHVAQSADPGEAYRYALLFGLTVASSIGLARLLFELGGPTDGKN